LRPIQREQDRRERSARPQFVALRNQESASVVGLAAVGPDPLWPDTHLLDVYCHPKFWERAAEMVRAILPAEGDRCLAYSDSDCPAKGKALEEAGFGSAFTHRNWVGGHTDGDARLDVRVWERV
ncbi:MAG: hypothetical protein QGI83_05155, partial [Candidatus Latescibacteria bacterium]|nr:hypothetical protein [Candidatus Latescibacterota bacterium]